MPDLEPITREEKLWSGEDIEPITREEMYIKHIFDKTQTIPSKPLTRKEMLLEKAGEGGGSDVTIKQLSVTENGTYSEENTAYSPVIVNVPAPPIPDNAYLLNDLSGLPADIATFTDGSSLPMPSLKVGIEPIQSGSGDPSPTNIRPISGWTDCEVTVADDLENPTVSNVYTIDLGGTRYGGTLDVVSGVLTVEKASVDLGTLNWTYSSETNRERFSAMLSGVKWVSDSIPINAICSALVVTDFYTVYNHIIDNTIGMWHGTTLAVCSSAYTDVATFKTAMNGVQLVYELATPITYQLTPTQVKSLLGSNNVWGDCGKIIDGQYFSKGE